MVDKLSRESVLGYVLLLIGINALFSVALQGESIWKSFTDNSGFPLANIILTMLSLGLLVMLVAFISTPK